MASLICGASAITSALLSSLPAEAPVALLALVEPPEREVPWLYARHRRPERQNHLSQEDQSGIPGGIRISACSRVLELRISTPWSIQVCFFQQKTADVVKAEIPFAVLEEA